MLSRINGRLAALSALIALGVADPAYAAISLDLLSDCTFLSEIREDLKADRIDCRVPSGELERTFSQRTQWAGGCFFTSARSPLKSFSCYYSNVDTTYSQFLCMKYTLKQNLDDYKNYYASYYAPYVKNYLDRAAQCSVGNGDSSISVWSMMPQLLNWIAKYRFGFILPTGPDLVGDNMILHGFADLDPSIRDGMAVEYFMTDLRR
jgi:hypothetical protein